MPAFGNIAAGNASTPTRPPCAGPVVTGLRRSLSGLVDQKQMRDLPLNGRSFEQLALLQPGVNAVEVGGNDPVGGRTNKISINGTRPEQSSFLLDGTDINNVYNKTPGSVGGVLLGVEAVLEFQVLTNSYSAEFGRSAGGVVNAVTRSGTNQMRGSLFEFLRNSKMDAKNFFDPGSDPFMGTIPLEGNPPLMTSPPFALSCPNDVDTIVAQRPKASSSEPPGIIFQSPTWLYSEAQLSLQTLRKPMLNELARVLDSIPAAKLGCVITGSETEDDSSYGYGGGYYNYSRKREQMAEAV